jgi:sugar phosphate isomerase/epimerase
MKDPWQSYLQLGVVHFMLYPECLGGEGPLVETVRDICHDPFFEAIDVGPMHNTWQRRECAALLRDSRMTVAFACQPVQLQQGLDLNSADAEQRHAAVEAIVGLLDQAKELGATRFAIMSGKTPPLPPLLKGRTNDPPPLANGGQGVSQRAALDHLITQVRRICKEARDRAGLPVVLEIFDHDMDKKALIGTCELAAQLAREVRRDHPDFGLLHDLSHIYLCHEEPARHFPLIREYLVAMHIGNSVSRRGHPLFGDTHSLFGIDGGDSDVPQLRNFIKVLFDIGYLGRAAGFIPDVPIRRPVVGFEIRTPSGTDPRTVVANMKRTWQRAWWEW